MKVWVTKYALTKGILKFEKAEDTRDGMVYVKGEHGFDYGTYFHYEGKDWHRTAKAAFKRAEEMRLGKIESLKKQIEKLKVMDFTKRG